MLSTLTIKGSHSDFKIMPSEAGGGLLLIGVSPSNQGMVVLLSGYQAVEFSNCTINLAETIWASSANEKTMPISFVDVLEQFQSLNSEDINQGLPHKTQLDLEVKSVKASSHSFLPDANDESVEVSPRSASLEPFSQQSHHALLAHPSNQKAQQSESHHADGQDASRNKNVQSASSSSGGGVGGSGSSMNEDFNVALKQNSANSANSAASETQVDYFPKSLFGTSTFDNLQGAEGNDVFYTSSGNDIIKGSGGVDTLVGVDFSAIKIDQISQDAFKLIGNFSEIYEAPVGLPNYGVDVNGSLYFSGIEIFKRVDDEEGVELARIVNASEFNDRLKPFDETQAWAVDGLNGNDELIGGKAADDIKGGTGDDIIDGAVNSLADSDEFIENLDGGDGNDHITYRGFDASFQTTPSSIIANINGGSGNDLIAVNLDQLSHLNIDGGEGLDILALQAPAGIGSLWQSSFLEWSWRFQNNQHLMTAQYISKPEAGFFEVNSTFEKIAIGLSGAGQSYHIIRPQYEARLTMTGTQAADFILAVEGGAKINAGDGNDIVIAKQGAIISLGSGINELHVADTDFTLSYEWSSAGIRVDLASQLGLVFDGDGDLLALDRINNTPDILIASNNADTLMGSAQDNTIYGGQGDDVIISAGGNDLIFGGDGHDTMTFNGKGQSFAEGGAGADTFILDFDFSSQNTLTISDLDFAQGDRVSINLGALAKQTNYGAYQVVDTSGSLIFAKDLQSDVQAVLNLVLNQEAGMLSFDDGLSQTDFMFVNDGFDGLSAAQLATLINIDYY